MLDSTLHALSDSTRRDMLLRMVKQEHTVSELAEPYDMSMAAVSKHLKVLESANLITKRKEGRRFHCRMNYEPLIEVSELLKIYRQFWEDRFNELEHFVEESKMKGNK